MEKLKFVSNEFLEEMFKVSTLFAGGIYIRYDKARSVNQEYIHPCGWDFLSFENVEEVQDDNPEDYDWSILNYVFEVEDFSNGIYQTHPLEGYTLKEILKIVGEDNWSFEGF